MLNPTRIRAITLDLDDTLWPIWPTIERAEGLLQDWLRPHAPAAAALLAHTPTRQRLRAQALERCGHVAHDLGAIRLELIRLALAEARAPEDLAEPAYGVFLEARHHVTWFADVAQGLATLAQHFPLVALTNGNADLHKTGVGPYFVAGLTAKEAGMAKPDPRIFEMAASLAGVPADSVLHVGDDPALDVVGARAAGMQAVWVNRHGHTWSHAADTPVQVPDLHALCAALGLGLGPAQPNPSTTA